MPRRTYLLIRKSRVAQVHTHTHTCASSVWSIEHDPCVVVVRQGACQPCETRINQNEFSARITPYGARMYVHYVRDVSLLRCVSFAGPVGGADPVAMQVAIQGKHRKRPCIGGTGARDCESQKPFRTDATCKALRQARRSDSTVDPEIAATARNSPGSNASSPFDAFVGNVRRLPECDPGPVRGSPDFRELWSSHGPPAKTVAMHG